jgi:hypothetical protein
LSLQQASPHVLRITRILKVRRHRPAPLEYPSPTTQLNSSKSSTFSSIIFDPDCALKATQVSSPAGKITAAQAVDLSKQFGHPALISPFQPATKSAENMTTGNGAPPTLLTLPGELRNAIFERAMASPGRRLRLELIKRDAPPRFRFREEHAFSTFPLALALLQVCKQLNRECAGLFWEKNEILVDATFPIVESNVETIVETIEVFRDGLPVGPFLFIQHLEVQSSLDLGGNFTKRFFRDINRLARKGGLKSLTIKGWAPNLSYSGPRLSLQSTENTISRAVAQLRVLTRHLDEDCIQMQKSLVLEFSLARRIILGFSTSYDLDTAFKDLHWAFGGEVWFQDPVHFDQILLWKDHKQFSRIVVMG